MTLKLLLLSFTFTHNPQIQTTVFFILHLSIWSWFPPLYRHLSPNPNWIIHRTYHLSFLILISLPVIKDYCGLPPLLQILSLPFVILYFPNVLPPSPFYAIQSSQIPLPSVAWQREALARIPFWDVIFHSLHPLSTILLSLSGTENLW